ncbi:hypothetical protein JCM16418_1435 [Paenibacillus pini JCM 16418]|uniref:Uncharacterized protein n=1 Tax=Paenibacillus pini JCM 16418 TaxID=1236976 RepID=W7YYB1_9BACL|nr:hypothetical protein JCM16418_1435 [Paenibacillus pini JCM 16418]
MKKSRNLLILKDGQNLTLPDEGTSIPHLSGTSLISMVLITMLKMVTLESIVLSERINIGTKMSTTVSVIMII